MNTEHDNDQPEVFTSKEAPWGVRDAGFKVGDYVNIIHSDHVDYIFDNPSGVITKITVNGVEVDNITYDPVPDAEEVGWAEGVRITVAVEAEVGPDRLLLVARRQS